MRRSRTHSRKVLVTIALWILGALPGCDDFSKFHFGNLRREQLAERPMPAPALYIPNSPALARSNPDDGLKQTKFTQTPDNPSRPLDSGAAEALQDPRRALYQRAVQRYSVMDSYIFRLKRREVVIGRKQPEEVIQVKLRREPFSVYLKWLGDEGKGREVVYVHGRYKNQMQVLLPADDLASLLGGRRHSVSPTDSLAKSRSRYPITDTGFGKLIERYGKMVAGIEKGDQREGTAKYLGKLNRPEFKTPVEAVHQVLPAGADPLLPRGGQRWWYFDAASGLPVLLIAHDPDGEVEYYCHDHILCPVSLDEEDFNPDRLWRSSK